MSIDGGGVLPQRSISSSEEPPGDVGMSNLSSSSSSAVRRGGLVELKR